MLMSEDGGVAEFTPAGPAPRVSTTEEITGYWGEIPIKRIAYGEIVGLPDEQPDTIIVVSQLCCQAAPTRRDLYFPADLKRDEAGRIVGCCTLGQV